MKKIKHKKYKNTGILYEMLLATLTSDILRGNNKPKAIPIIKKYFYENTEIKKELMLYQTLISEKYSDRNLALSLIESVRQSRKHLNEEKIRKEKFNLYRDIVEGFSEESFFNIPVENYKEYAAIYTLFEYEDRDNPEIVLKNKECLLESISTKSDHKIKSVLREESEEVRLMAFKLMVDRFNDTYKSKLLPEQHTLLCNYVNMTITSEEFIFYVKEESKSIKNSILSNISKITESSVKDSLLDAVDKLDLVSKSKSIKEDQVFSLLNYYELVKELYKV